MYARYEYEGEFKEEFLFSAALPQRTTALEISKTIIDYIENNRLDIKNCVGICSDGAATMIGEKSGVIRQIKDFASECVSTHCFLRRKSLATEKLSSNLNNVLCEVVKIVNHIKGSPLNSRLFAVLCDDMQANHKQLLFHSSVRWLSREKSCQECMNSGTSWQCFCMIKNQNGHSYSEMNIGLPCLLTYLIFLLFLMTSTHQCKEGMLHFLQQQIK